MVAIQPVILLELESGAVAVYSCSQVPMLLARIWDPLFYPE